MVLNILLHSNILKVFRKWCLPSPLILSAVLMYVFKRFCTFIINIDEQKISDTKPLSTPLIPSLSKSGSRSYIKRDATRESFHIRFRTQHEKRESVSKSPLKLKKKENPYYRSATVTLVLTCHHHVGRPADDFAPGSPRHALTLIVVLAKVFLHVIPGDVDDGLHVAHAGLRVHEVRDQRFHRGVVHAVTVAPEIHG